VAGHLAASEVRDGPSLRESTPCQHLVRCKRLVGAGLAASWADAERHL
jgi:hypothetical protein